MRYAQDLPAGKFLGSKNNSLVQLCAGKTVLHLGFVNEGFFEENLNRCIWLHAKLDRVAKRVVGVDISETGVARSRDLGYSDCYVGDVEHLTDAKFPRLSYDLIVAADIIEHLANPGLFLKSLHDFASEHTSIVITTPNALSLKTVSFPLFRKEIVHPDHNFYYSPATLKTLLGKYGFEVEQIGLYSDVWKPSKAALSNPVRFVAKSMFAAIDFIVRYSIIPLFPYFSEGMLFQVRKSHRQIADEPQLQDNCNVAAG